MQLHLVDWAIIILYGAFAISVGLLYRGRASRNVTEYFLSGRTLPWWLAGTSMIATSFAADTPLAVSGWVRDFGIWKNWLWWCYGINGILGAFLFTRWWRRGGVMTKAEVAELRYSGPEARVLRGTLGVFHTGFSNMMILCWVILAASKILDALFGIDKVYSVSLACAIAMTYSLLAGLWGVVITDFLQFLISIVGAVTLAALCWSAIGGSEGLQQAKLDGLFGEETLQFLPTAGSRSPFDAEFWTVSVAAFCVYIGVSWWAVENVDGSGIGVQRISASRNEKHGVLSVLWFNIGHYALRPWPWIVVGLASLIILPPLKVTSPIEGEVIAIERSSHITVQSSAGETHDVSLTPEGSAEDWQIERILVDEGHSVASGQLMARSDSERAYVVMLRRYLPIGLLGLVVASLLAAFMSTIDTHVNLAASFFVNDVYRRFLKPQAKSERHYVIVARVASITIMFLAGVMAWQADSISDLFLFFLAFLGGVGPVYVMRWLWWRIRASTEIVAMITSGLTTATLTYLNTMDNPVHWELGPLSPDGQLAAVGRILIVVVVSTSLALLSLKIFPAPNPRDLVSFYRKVRPSGFWGPVREFCPDVQPDTSWRVVLVGTIGSLVGIGGVLFGTGHWLFGDPGRTSICAALSVIGFLGTAWSLRRMKPATDSA